MAKYAQGYGRKNSDTKNLIILFSSIVAVIVVAIVIAVIVGKVKKPAKTLNDYTSYQITDYSRLLDQKEGNYLIYCYSSNSSSDSNTNAVIKYIEAYEAKTCTTKLYLIDAHLFTQSDYTSSDSYYSTAGTNATTIKTEIPEFTPAEGNLFSIIDNNFTSTATQLVTAQKTQGTYTSVSDYLKKLMNNEKALGLNSDK